jgi:adenylosuccinate synthase
MVPDLIIKEIEMVKMDVIVDLQFGSTGKGALAGWLSEVMGYDAVISVNMPNAGHTAYSPDTDQKFVHKVLPSGIFSDKLKKVCIGPGSVFSLDRLEEEWKAVCQYKPGLTLVIHEAAGLLQPEHRAREQASLSRISSTMQGSAEAMISKIRREEGAIVKYHSGMISDRLNKYDGNVIIVSQSEWLRQLSRSWRLLLEGSQGYSLSINAGFYPFCTSRDCTPARVIADASLPVNWLRHVYGSARVHPIRVGNTPDGYSGDWYPDQRELAFEALGVEPELTTVTQRVRRIATFSNIQIREAMQMASPHKVFLNFYQYDTVASQVVEADIAEIADDLGCGKVGLRGLGPRPGDIEEI